MTIYVLERGVWAIDGETMQNDAVNYAVQLARYLLIETLDRRLRVQTWSHGGMRERAWYLGEFPEKRTVEIAFFIREDWIKYGHANDWAPPALEIIP